MGPELLLLLLGSLGLGSLSGVALWWERRAQSRHIIRIRTAWVRAGHVIRFGPIGAAGYGTLPQRTYTRGAFGALGLTGSALVFDGHRRTSSDVNIPYEAIRWIGLHEIPVQSRRIVRHYRACAIHYQQAGNWRVVAFVLDDPREFGEQLARQTDLPLVDLGDKRPDYGPAEATRARQDIYGEWTPERTDALYLAPDRLLFTYRDAIPLETITRLDVITRERLSNRLAERLPFTSDLLRVSYHPDQGEPQTVGFLVRQPDRWADAITRRRASPLFVHTGRKRKEE